jgi:zinc transport system substrate-binding protein
MNPKVLLMLLAIVIIGGFLYFSTLKTVAPVSDKIQVNTSFYPLYFFSSQIGKDKADIKNITPSGSEPHDYEPTAQDIARIENSQLLILNGGVESWGDKIKESLKGRRVKVVTAGEGLFTRDLNEEGETIKDPHIWLSPLLAKKQVDKITQGFIEVDPKNSSFYQANQKELDKKLDNLDMEYKKGLANCQSKEIITSHEAFGYLTSAYGLRQVSIAGLSPDEEPSSQQLAEVSKFARVNNVKYIFFETLISPKLSETIANETGAKTLVLDPLEGLSDDDIKSGNDYFSVMQDNLKNIQTALQCS